MFKSRVVVLLMVSILASAASAAAPKGDSAKQPAGQKVGVVDVNYLLKNHAGLKKKLLELKVAMELTMAKLESEAKAAGKKEERLKDLTIGSPEYKTLEEELVKTKANLQAEIAMQRKDYTQRQGQAYYETYQEIMKDVEKISKSQRLSVVLNVSKQEINAEDPNEVVRAISKGVLWFDESTDLTPELEKNYGP